MTKRRVLQFAVLTALVAAYLAVLLRGRLFGV